MTIICNSNASLHKVLLEHSHAHLFTHPLWRLSLEWRSWIVVKDTTWPTAANECIYYLALYRNKTKQKLTNHCCGISKTEELSLEVWLSRLILSLNIQSAEFSLQFSDLTVFEFAGPPNLTLKGIYACYKCIVIIITCTCVCVRIYEIVRATDVQVCTDSCI